MVRALVAEREAEPVRRDVMVALDRIIARYEVYMQNVKHAFGFEREVLLLGRCQLDSAGRTWNLRRDYAARIIPYTVLTRLMLLGRVRLP